MERINWGNFTLDLSPKLLCSSFEKNVSRQKGMNTRIRPAHDAIVLAAKYYCITSVASLEFTSPYDLPHYFQLCVVCETP